MLFLCVFIFALVVLVAGFVWLASCFCGSGGAGGVGLIALFLPPCSCFLFVCVLFGGAGGAGGAVDVGVSF